MTRAEAIKLVVSCLKDELVVHANGMICRESFAVQDRPENFYMIGSMGLASSIALGVAISRPNRKVVVFDGDGNILMNLGGLALVGHLKPRNFVHIVFDNESYGSTGGQKTISGSLRLEEVAKAAGYTVAERVEEEKALVEAVNRHLHSEGPTFLLVKVEAREEGEAPRIPHPPETIRDQFMACLLKPAKI